MKKLFFALVCMVMSISANAHVFDGIDLNADMVQITRQISAKGYTYDVERGCLKGNCQGTEIFLSFNQTDTSNKSKIGQLIIDVPMTGAEALNNAAMVFNVIYHQTANQNGVYTYKVNEDGTTMTLTATDKGIKIAFNTPYYKKK